MNDSVMIQSTIDAHEGRKVVGRGNRMQTWMKK